MKQICVFCGSSPGLMPEYGQMAQALGRALAKNEIGLVYGGGSVGMMGILAKAVMENNGRVTGVITQQLYEMEVAFTQGTELKVVDTMHERKALMADLSDAFIALPGGLGTLDEMFEILTWAQLGIHEKPCGFLNVNGYFDKLIAFVDHMIAQKFIKADCRALIQVDETPTGLLEQFKRHTPLPSSKGEWAKALAVG